MLMFFFQAEDGIRYRDVTGVQTCALPIYDRPGRYGHLPPAQRDSAAVIAAAGRVDVALARRHAAARRRPETPRRRRQSDSRGHHMAGALTQEFGYVVGRLPQQVIEHPGLPPGVS